MPFFLKNAKETPGASGSSSGDDNRCQPSFNRQDSMITLESYTAPDIRGAGRTLGRLTTYIGTKIEEWVSQRAIKTGNTPFAVKTQLEEIGRKLKKRPRPYEDYSQLSSKDERLMKHLCGKILDWVHKNKSPGVQLQAIQAIVELVSVYPALSGAFKGKNAGKYLRTVLPDRERAGNETRCELYVRTRDALVCVEEVEVLKRVCSMDVHIVRRNEGEDIANQLAAYAANAHVSFLVLRCFERWWDWADTTGRQLLECSAEIARADKTAVDWDALQGALWWLEMRWVMVEGDVIVNGVGFDPEDIASLGRFARQRADFCTARGIVVPDDAQPEEVTAILRSRTAVIPILWYLEHNLDSYPCYLYMHLAKHFPQVDRTHFDRTVDRLVACYTSADPHLHEDAKLVLRFLASHHSWFRYAIARRFLMLGILHLRRVLHISRLS